MHELNLDPSLREHWCLCGAGPFVLFNGFCKHAAAEQRKVGSK